MLKNVVFHAWFWLFLSESIPNIQTHPNFVKYIISPILSTSVPVIVRYKNLLHLDAFAYHHKLSSTSHASNLRCMSLRGGKRSGVQDQHAFIGGDGRTVANVNNDGEIVGSTVPWIDALIKAKQKVLAVCAR
jgi:hypothetical protein